MRKKMRKMRDSQGEGLCLRVVAMKKWMKKCRKGVLVLLSKKKVTIRMIQMRKRKNKRMNQETLMKMQRQKRKNS